MRASNLALLACAGLALVGGLSLATSHAPPVPQSTGSPVAGPGAGRITYPAGMTPSFVLPGGERKPVHSLLNITRPMAFGEFRWDEEGVPPGEVWVRIDLARQTLSVFRAGHEIGTAVILFGSDGTPTPTGLFTVLDKDADYHSRTYDAPMPYMLRLTTDGVALHASNVRRGSATHGCIGTPPDFARKLFAAMAVGDSVAIFSDAAKPA